MDTKIYGMRYTADEKTGKYELHFDNYCKVFYSYEEMENFILCANVKRFQINIMLYNLRRNDVISLVMDDAYGNARICDNMPERGAFIFEWIEEPTQTNDLPRIKQNHIGAVLGVAYDNVKDVSILNKEVAV